MSDHEGTRTATRSRIVEAAASLLHEHGPAAVTTRRVAERAGVQQPTIYRAVGDKDELLDAVAEHVMATFAATKAEAVRAAAADDVDPVADLIAAWQSQIAFGLANPAVFRLLSDPARVARSPAARSGRRALEARVHRIAAAGRLCVGEPRAVAMIQAAGVGAINATLAPPPEQRDPGLADAMLTAVLAQILVDAPDRAEGHAIAAAAVTMRALAPELAVLSDAERSLLDDWLARVVDAL